MNRLPLSLMFLSLLLTGLTHIQAQNTSRPNVVLIISDDQGYGDLGINGNKHIKTPVLDKFAQENIRFNNFYVSPVCAPTRSSLMTGRFSLRTGIRDTYNGGATMAASEVTIAEMLKQADYATGAFGKWHLGDNYPSRPGDQGFDESVIHLSGGMGQVGDITTFFRRDSSYFDPVLWHNGHKEAYEGYCSDIFTSEALRFIEGHQNQPFFCYLAFNAPHTPLQVPEEYYRMYKDIDPSEGYEKDGKPFTPMSEKDKEDARRVYAMVTNLDENVGRVLDKLNELNLEKETLVIFMTDNGPQQVRYVAGMRGRKGHVFRGGVRVPFYLRYPPLFDGTKDIATTVAHIDILPTLSELCGVDLPAYREIDGRSILPLIRDEKTDHESRPLFFYWTRRFPEKYNNMAVQKNNFKLVGHTDYNSPLSGFELFNIAEDPYEQNNIIDQYPGLAKDLKKELDNLYNELVLSPNLVKGQAAVIGTPFENPVFLNRNDADGERGIWSHEDVFGKWLVDVKEGVYNIRFKFLKPIASEGKMYLEAGSIIHQFHNTDLGKDILEMKQVSLPDIKGDLIPFYMTKGRRILPFWVELEKIND